MGGSGSIVVGSYVVGDGVGSSVLHGHNLKDDKCVHWILEKLKTNHSSINT